MRTVLLADLLVAVRGLLAVPKAERGALLQRALYQAHAAHAVQKRLGRPHPAWGTGRLSDIFAHRPRAREPFAGEPEFLEVLALVAESLLRRRNPAPDGTCARRLRK